MQQETFKGENFSNLVVFWLLAKVSPQNLGRGMSLSTTKQCIHKSFVKKSSAIHKSFLLQKIPAIGNNMTHNFLDDFIDLSSDLYRDNYSDDSAYYNILLYCIPHFHNEHFF